MKIPKGWLRVQADSETAMIYRAPHAPQEIRIVPVGHVAALGGDEGVKKIRETLAKLPFKKFEVTKTTVCGGTQSAILAKAQNVKGQTIMEQIVAMGGNGGFVITYSIQDGHPDRAAESAIHTICT